MSATPLAPPRGRREWPRSRSRLSLATSYVRYWEIVLKNSASPLCDQYLSWLYTARRKANAPWRKKPNYYCAKISRK